MTKEDCIVELEIEFGTLSGTEKKIAEDNCPAVEKAKSAIKEHRKLSPPSSIPSMPSIPNTGR